MEDGKIIELYWARDQRAVRESDEKYGRYCHSISYNILYNDQDAQECVNDTWLNAWNAMPPQRPNRLAVFLGKITRNLSLNRYRLYHVEKRGQGQTALALSELEECVSTSNSPEQASEERLLVESIESFLYAQPQQKRDIFVRRYWYLSAVKEIARDYSMSESKVKSLLFRMRGELKLHLEREGIVV